jgi:hypothetical protein
MPSILISIFLRFCAPLLWRCPAKHSVYVEELSRHRRRQTKHAALRTKNAQITRKDSLRQTNMNSTKMSDLPRFVDNNRERRDSDGPGSGAFLC